MELMYKLKESESIVIEGDKKIGKTTLSIFLANSLQKKFTFLTPISPNKITRKIEALQKNFENFKNLNIDVFSFREDWVLVKNEYGFDYLLKDLEYFISHQKNEIIVFHKLDSIFEYADRDFIDDFFIELLAYGIKYKKKFIFTINIDSVNYDLVGTYLSDASDLYLKMTRPKDKREIEILFAISPIVDSHYIFENIDKKLIIKTKDISGYHKREIDVVLISKDKYIQKLHKYILDKEDINLRVIDSISESLSIVSNVPDFLIFTQEFDEMNFNICEISKENNFKTIYIIKKEFVRVDDRLEAREKGCVDVITFSMQTMHYILELEKFFSVVFYKNLIYTKPNLKNKQELLKYISFLLEEKVLFTIVKIEGKIENYSKFLRDYDVYMELNEYSIIVLTNLLKKEISEILFKKINQMFNILKVQDCLDLYFGEQLCIE